MAKLQLEFPVGDRQGMTTEKLLEIVETMYRELAQEINRKPDLFERDTDGLSTDTILSVGSINLNTITRKIEMLATHDSVSAVTWKTLT